MGLRVAVAVTIVAALPAAVASAASSSTTHRAAPSWAIPNWAAPQIRTVLARGLFGRTTAGAFHPNDELTRQALANLAFDLHWTLTPPVVVPPPTAFPPSDPAPTPIAVGPDGAGATDPTATDPTLTDPTATDPTVTAPAATDPTLTDPAATDPTATDPTATDPTATTTDPTATDPTTTATDPTATEPTVTTPAPTKPTPAAAKRPAAPPKVARPDGVVTMTALDARLVASLGLSKAAAEFAKAAKADGLTVPARFGNEVVARLLGLRLDHPAAQDFLELRPQDPATRAEAAFSAAQILGFGWLGNSWQTAAAQSLADSFSLPALSEWQKRILDVAVSKIGMPYIWGGTSDGPEAPFGVHSRGGYDCSGFVWRVYKLQAYPDERSLASTLQGRTTYVMSVEVPASERIPFAKLQPADVVFFGAHGPRSSSAEIDHMAIYLGNGWIIQSSGAGVALAPLSGWYRQRFAWGRRPLQEAGLAG